MFTTIITAEKRYCTGQLLKMKSSYLRNYLKLFTFDIKTIIYRYQQNILHGCDLFWRLVSVLRNGTNSFTCCLSTSFLDLWFPYRIAMCMIYTGETIIESWVKIPLNPENKWIKFEKELPKLFYLASAFFLFYLFVSSWRVTYKFCFCCIGIRGSELSVVLAKLVEFKSFKWSHFRK